MRSTTSSVGLSALACLLLVASVARADERRGSDAADGHGPDVPNAMSREAGCAGVSEPDVEDCRAIGSRRDPASVRARSDRVAAARATAALVGAGAMGAPAAVPLMGAAAPSAPEVEVGEAPVGRSAAGQALRPLATGRPSSRERGHVDAMPLSYDYGGGGLMIEGSASLTGRVRAFVRLGAATDYREALLGGSWLVTPTALERLTLALTAGVETGRFELDGSGVSTSLADTGLYVGIASRLVVDARFEFQAGIGYSTFFEGDPIAFGGGFYRVSRRVDILSRVELGDNDSLGIGVRYHY